MKKTISINLSGLNFFIEEDGFDKLNAYLTSIRRYFATYEDSTEIIADIEARIAEIFYQKLSPSKQAITIDDVNQIIATMGSISDFQEIEEPAEHAGKAGYTAGSAYTTGNTSNATGTNSGAYSATEPVGSKKLYRDHTRKILGGVAAGIANYFSVDPIWVRVFLAILLIVGNMTNWFNFNDGHFALGVSFSGFIVLAYIICWIVIPARYDLKTDESIKKLFRDPNDKVLGGVCTGLAGYFGADVIAIRLAFLLMFLMGGFGAGLYLVLWIITPEAKTLADKMKMQGEPLTLANIEANIKNSLDIKPGQEESTAAKILLFPFRFIALVFTKLAEMLGPILKFLLEAVRIIAGILMILLSFSFMIAAIVSFGHQLQST